jgi:hypothetical protein
MGTLSGGAIRYSEPDKLSGYSVELILPTCRD